MTKDQILVAANSVNKNTLMETLSIKFIDVGEDFLKAKMPINKTVYQPDGVLHGGATAALAESVGSAAVFILNKDPNILVRGIEISCNHLKSAKSGFVYAIAKPVHNGRNIQLWEIRVTDDNDDLISLCKLTTFSRSVK